MQTLFAGYFLSPLGPLTITAQEEGICDISFCKGAPRIQTVKNTLLQEAFQQLNAYFAGQRNVFKLPLVTDGTPFQKKIWEAIYKIPYGQSTTYSQLADSVKHPASFRAVANACGQNRIPIIIPCHRILGKNNLGGFSGGLDIKKKLLKQEGMANLK